MTLDQAENELIELNPQPFYIPLGKWAPIIEGAFSGMSTRHWIFAGPRGRIGATLRGAKPQRLLNAQDGAKPYKLAPCSHHPARRALHAVGSALSTQQPTLCILGDAALASGEFHQALSISTQYQCPIIFLLIRHPLTDDAPVTDQYSTSTQSIASALGIQYQNVSPQKKTIENAVHQAAQSSSPYLIETTLEK
ncbi:MAG: hypothetical protein CL916_11265 [Deltaproteobacteria bacterium]|nr:hypothetical protein [Deltaproteobacteria bacterium]